jgi:hypothetical protein
MRLLRTTPCYGATDGPSGPVTRGSVVADDVVYRAVARRLAVDDEWAGQWWETEQAALRQAARWVRKYDLVALRVESATLDPQVFADLSHWIAGER